MFPFFLIVALPGLLISINFIHFLVNGRRLLNVKLNFLLELAALIILPLLFLSFSDFGLINECCNDSAFFSPGHRLTVYALILLCLFFYFYSAYRRTLTTPIIELVTNCFLLIGIFLNVVIAMQASETLLWLIGNVPIILLFILTLAKNHHLFISNYEAAPKNNLNIFEKICWKILQLKPLQKFPILLISCLPLLFLIIALLMIFRQKPDSIISVFTETYRHGLSTLDCTNVKCPDGHFLCTVAASGHNKFVKPLRAGLRHGYQIKVNRQLLISNAFEELLEEKIPHIHKPIRAFYTVTGGNFQKLYLLLGNKWIADAVYILMKPMELLFLLVLYTFDNQPENRIARQYISREDKMHLENASLLRQRPHLLERPIS